ncbi:helix-turn-helix transcriptional regulator [Paenibacillus sp. GCM10027626]|uniref:helix-turn-helix transcriptional regulator n=1 Tax=Paenibacillus sp. GCM10027626 TaxID=3273411 RepID=UPI00362B9E9E
MDRVMSNGRGAEFNHVLEFIEKNLKNELCLETIASYTAISKYHFHRLFHAHVGMTLASYIRKRRLSNAASELISAEKRILDIALDYQFESQEAFTRAFKKMFHMTPGQYRVFIPKLIQKKERTYLMNQAQKEPAGWMLNVNGTHMSDCEMGIDFQTTHHGKASGYLDSKGENVGGFATMMQVFKANEYRGRRLQLSGFLKTLNVEQWCGLWMRIDGKEQEILQFDNMCNRPVTGTAEWNRYNIVLDVPQSSETISFGALIIGKGRVWVDSLRFDTVSESVPTTNMEEEAEVPDRPVNLNFEEFHSNE